MYELTKFAGWLLSPLPLGVLGSLVALLLVWRGWRRAGLGLGALSLAGLWLASTPWLAWTLASSLEARFPPVAVADTPAADAVLVLGGALAAAHPPLKPHMNLGSAADRVWHAGALYRAGKVRWVVLVGGNQPGFEHVQPEAEAMRDLLRVVGVPDAAMRLETRSKTTRENARNGVNLLQQLGVRRVLLVTSAIHMPRAMAVFHEALRGTGIAVLAATTDAEALGDELDPLGQWLPEASSLAWSTRSIKEYLGWVQVWVTGRLS